MPALEAEFGCYSLWTKHLLVSHLSSGWISMMDSGWHYGLTEAGCRGMLSSSPGLLLSCYP